MKLRATKDHPNRAALILPKRTVRPKRVSVHSRACQCDRPVVDSTVVFRTGGEHGWRTSGRNCFEPCLAALGHGGALTCQHDLAIGVGSKHGVKTAEENVLIGEQP